MKQKSNPHYGILTILSAVAFFLLAFSDLALWLKILATLATLSLSGIAIAHWAKQPGYHGLVVFRGKSGFNLMHSLAKKHPKLFTELSDFGLTLFFGALYGFLLFRKKPWKLLVHLILLAFFSFGLQFVVPGMEAFAGVFIAISILFGLAASFFLAVFFQAFHIATNFSVATPGAMPAIPGLTIPIEAIISIVILMVVHELAHGVMFCIEKLKVKSSGVILFGFLPIGAFVEQDEKEFAKAPIDKKRRILVAGSTANFITAIIFIALLVPASMALVDASGGLKIESVLTNSSAFGALSAGEVIVGLNGQPTKTAEQLTSALKDVQAGSKVTVETDQGPRELTLKQNGKIGVTVTPAAKKGGEGWHGFISVIYSILSWTALLNLMIALFNVMPLFITDGHLIIRNELIYRLGKKRATEAKLIAKIIGLIFLAILVVNFLPWIKA